MSIHIILVTHNHIGKALVSASTLIFGQLPLATSHISVEENTDDSKIQQALQSLINSLNNPDGILLLTDLYGATPCNLVQRLPARTDVKHISGVNLPMLLKIMNYANLSLDEIVDKALAGGRQGIMVC